MSMEMFDLWSSDKINELINVQWIKNIYWKLEDFSCVLVLRNCVWFKNNIDTIQNLWNIIEKERITGHEHRAPNKRTTTTSHLKNNNINSDIIGIPFNFNKVI